MRTEQMGLGMALLALLIAGCMGGEEEHAGHADEDCAKACAKKDAVAAASHEGYEDHHGQEDHGGHEGHGHEGHDHGGDLERSIDELLAQECEHDRRAVECDQCRYEVGAVRVDPQLVDLALVSFGEVQRSEVALPIEMNATVGFDELRTVHVSPRVAGTVRSLEVDYGDVVKRGQTLFTLDSQELGEAAGAFLEARAAERLADQRLQRQEELRAAGVTSEREYEEAVQAQQATAIQLATARDRLLRMGLSNNEIDPIQAGGGGAAIGVLPVRAPLSGTVLDLHASPGELVEPGAETALVGDLSTVWVWADVYEEDLATVAGALAAGEVPATFSTAAVPDGSFAGSVDVLGASLDATTRTTRARIVVDNAGGLLRAGMFGTVTLALHGREGGLTVPSVAVCSDGDLAFVFVRGEGDLFFRRAVTAGRSADGVTEVRGDVESGQQVLADGSFLARSEVLKEKMGAGCAH